VDSGRFRALQDGSILQIIGVYKRDEGVYTCIADNGIGRPATLDITLAVTGKFYTFNIPLFSIFQHVIFQSS
jgi:hypothetical protein